MTEMSECPIRYWSVLEFIPALAAQFVERIAGRFNLLDGEWVDAAARVAASRKATEAALAHGGDQRLGHHATNRTQ